MAKKVRYTQPLLGEANAAGYLIAVPGASVLIRQNGVACTVYSSNAGAAMTNPVPSGVAPGTAGVDTRGTLVVYLEPGTGYDGVATVGNVASTFAIPDISPDVSDVQAPIAAGTYVGGTATGGGDTLTLSLSAASVPNSGTKGLRLNRAALGAPAGTTLLTGNVPMWDAVTLDYETNDLVIAGSHNTDGAGTFGDQLRLDQRGYGEYGKSVGLQSALRRFSFSSTAADDPAMHTLLKLDMQAGSPVTIALDVVSSGTTTARIFKNGKFLLGPVAATSDAGVACFTDAVSDRKGALEVNNTGAGGQKFQLIPGNHGVTNGGFTIRDATNSLNRLIITPAGTLVLGGTAAAIPTTATAGHVVIPYCIGTPTGVPEAYAGGIAMMFDAGSNKLYAYLGGSWKATAAFV
jgi:hypothetical protein